MRSRVLERGFAASPAEAERSITDVVTGCRSRGGTTLALSSPGAHSVVLATVRRDGFDEVTVVGVPDADVCVALGFSIHGLGEWSKTSPADAETWPGDAAVAAAALATDIDLGRAGIAWQDGRESSETRTVLLRYFGSGGQRFTLPPKINQDRLLTYDRNGRLARAVLAVSRPPRIEPVSLQHLQEYGIRTAADFIGTQVDHLSVRRTSFVVRRDGAPLQIRGIGSERALSLTTWRQWIDAGRAPIFG